MANIFHRLFFRNAGARQFGCGGNAETVKADARKLFLYPVAGEKVKPILTGAGGLGVGFDFPFIEQSSEKVHQRRMQKQSPRFPSLHFKCDRRFVRRNKPDTFLGIKVGFGNSNSVVVGNLKRVVEKLPQWLGLLLDCRSNHGNNIRRQLGFNAAGNSFDAKLETGIGRRVFPSHRLVHNNGKGFQFQQRRVVTGLIFAATFVWLLAPGEILGAMLSPKLAGKFDLFFGQEHCQCAPCGFVSEKALRLAGVSKVDESRNPIYPSLVWADGVDFGFGQGLGGAQLLCPAGVRADADAELCALSFGFAADGISEFDPPKRGLTLLVQTCHIQYAQVCPAYRKVTNNVKQCRTLSKMVHAYFESAVRFRPQPPLILQGFYQSVCLQYALAAVISPPNSFPGGREKSENSAGLLTPIRVRFACSCRRVTDKAARDSIQPLQTYA